MYNGKCIKCGFPRFRKDALSVDCLNCFNNASNNKILDKEELNNILFGKQEHEIQSLKREFHHLSNECNFYKKQLSNLVICEFKTQFNEAEEYAVNLFNKLCAKDAILSLMNDINRDVNEYLNNQQ